MTLYGIDISNHQGMPDAYRTASWYQQAQFVLIQAVAPPPPWPPGCTADQMHAAKADGKYVGAYVWLWNGLDTEPDITSKLALIPDDVTLDTRLWLDVEDTSVPFSQDKCLQALALCDTWATAHGLPPTGVYTGQWYIDGYMGGWFPPERLYWMADYAIPPQLFPARPVHQYASVPIDSDAMLESEIVVQPGTRPATPPPSNDCAPLIGAVAYMGDDLADKLYKVSTSKRVRAVADEMRRVRVQFDGPRP